MRGRSRPSLETRWSAAGGFEGSDGCRQGLWPLSVVEVRGRSRPSLETIWSAAGGFEARTAAGRVCGRSRWSRCEAVHGRASRPPGRRRVVSRLVAGAPRTSTTEDGWFRGFGRLSAGVVAALGGRGVRPFTAEPRDHLVGGGWFRGSSLALLAPQPPRTGGFEGRTAAGRVCGRSRWSRCEAVHGRASRPPGRRRVVSRLVAGGSSHLNHRRRVVSRVRTAVGRGCGRSRWSRYEAVHGRASRPSGRRRVVSRLVARAPRTSTTEGGWFRGSSLGLLAPQPPKAGGFEARRWRSSHLNHRGRRFVARPASYDSARDLA